jgi:hypothetical protein
MSLPDRERWKEVEPMLDELLGMAPKARERRLTALRLRDAPLALELVAMLGAAAAAEAERFLEGEAVDGGVDVSNRPLDS